MVFLYARPAITACLAAVWCHADTVGFQTFWLKNHSALAGNTLMRVVRLKQDKKVEGSKTKTMSNLCSTEL